MTPSLFDPLETARDRRIEVEPMPPAVRSSPTSVAAAKRMRSKAKSLREQVFDFIASQGSHGATTEEVEAALNRKHQSVSPRVGELKGKPGFPTRIVKVGERPTVGGGPADVFVALTQGNQ